MAHYTLLKYKFKYIFKSGPQERAKEPRLNFKNKAAK